MRANRSSPPSSPGELLADGVREHQVRIEGFLVVVDHVDDVGPAVLRQLHLVDKGPLLVELAAAVPGHCRLHARARSKSCPPGRSSSRVFLPLAASSFLSVAL